MAHSCMPFIDLQLFELTEAASGLCRHGYKQDFVLESANEMAE